MTTVIRPSVEEVFPYFQKYIDGVHGDDLRPALIDALERAQVVAEKVSAELEEHRYAPDKWSIKEVFQHVTDTERILSYRALCFARNDGTELPGFDEDAYAAHSACGDRSLRNIMSEHAAVRHATILLFNSLNEAALLRIGTANGKGMSARALGWTIAGHALHHIGIIEQRYLTT